MASVMFGGCGSLRAAANPKLPWAPTEGAPLTVVVHRARVAQETAIQVDRLMNGASVNAQSTWPSETQIGADLIAEHQQVFVDHPFYHQTKLRIPPAAIWARTLPHIAEPAPAAFVSPAAVEPAPLAEDEQAPPVPPPAPAAPQEPGNSLVASVSTELAARYASIGAQIAELARIEGEIEVAEQAADEAPNAQEKQQQLDKKAKLEAQVAAGEQRVEPLRKAFLAACQGAAKKLGPEQQQRLGVAFVNLRQAVDDAQTANGAAVLAYPLSLRGAKDALISAAKASASDYVFELTGKRVKMDGFQFSVTQTDGQIGLAINGMSPSDIGEIAIADLVSETIVRTQAFLVDSIKLLLITSDTQERLAFQAAALDSIIEGMADAGYRAPLAAFATPGSSMFGNLLNGLGGRKEGAKPAASSGGEAAVASRAAPKPVGAGVQTRALLNVGSR